MESSNSPFICAYVLDGKGAGRILDEAGVESWSATDGLLWVHFDVQSAAARDWLASQNDIDEFIHEALLALETRPRSIGSDGGQLLVLRGVNTNPGANPDDMVAIRLWIESNRILSSRRRKLLSIQDIRDAIESGNGPSTAGGFVTMLVERLANRIGNVVEDIEDALEAGETHTAGENILERRSRLGTLRRKTAAIRRYLAPQRDALDRLYREPGPTFKREETNELREQADRITRYLEDLDLARERAMVLQEELLAELAHEQNSRMYLLSVVAAVFLPLTFVTGLLGMNVAGLPGTNTPWAFLVSLAIMAGLGVALVAFFKWKKWI